MTDTAATAATAASTTAAAPPATEPEAPAPAAAPALAVGNLVSYTWEDTYTDSEQTRYGVVVGVNTPEEGSDEAPTVNVSWLEGLASMPADLLDTVTGA